MLQAIPEAIRTHNDFTNFNRCLREEDDALVVRWEGELLAWTQDKSLPDPYRIPPSSESNSMSMAVTVLIIAAGITLADVRLALAEEDKKRVEEGQMISHDVSASAFFTLGMDIQAQQ
jgi:hypothetical protein